MEKFYVTTPIYYVNDTATIGHAYTTIIGDIIARWNRSQGKNTFYLTGLDENSQKTTDAAKKSGISDIKKYTDDMAVKWKKVWKELNISNDDFIRTTEPRHKKIVEKFFKKVYEKGDIYKGIYEGLYCEGCEAFYLEKDLIEGKCPYHKKEPKIIKEENYFFKLTKYSDQVLDHIKKNPNFILPKSRRNEVISFINEGLKDTSISRQNVEWGIQLPIDKKHHFWVWFDALINYISGAEKYWPAELHILAKDILRFHCILWPAMLISAGYELPKTLFVHGFLTINGQKMGKSLGNAIDPLKLSEKYGVDQIRYFLAREIPFGQDGDFSEEALKNRINNELANDLGNLISRTLTLSKKLPEIKGKSEIKFNIKNIEKLMEEYRLTEALNEIWRYVQETNKYINQKEPWKLEGNELEKVLYSCLESIRKVSILLWPFIPQTSEKIFYLLKIEQQKLTEFNKSISKYKPKEPIILFKKIQ